MMAMKNVSYEKISEDDKETRKAYSLFSLLTFSWISDVFKTGSQRPLQQSDFLDVPEEDETNQLTEELQEKWNDELERSRQNGRVPRLWKTVLKLLSPTDILFVIFTGLVDSIGRFTQPFLLGYFLSALMHPDESHRYLLYGCTVLMMVTVVVRSLAMHQYDYKSLYLGMQLRSALKGIVYIKVNSVRSVTSNVILSYSAWE
ncbi:hypothetical protein OS493_000238 [Desmophyllum pertusum]|uniref:ABC transmembrane type-1 domain-containing protein n=1 Tax=Desmophyllum pertusum TaxID=174260 RepID=A0A9X0A7V9_9CNID|nr:hypothetical protein OS493_000238 [Desmophyllum pertusum]